MSFQSDIESINGLRKAYKTGLQALEPADRTRLEVTHPRNLCGSAAIDVELRDLYPDQSRWDYVICRNDADVEYAHFIEVHPATTSSNIREVEAKAEWLLTWLISTPFRNMERSLHWIATGTVSFTQRDPKIRSLALKGVTLSGTRLKIN